MRYDLRTIASHKRSHLPHWDCERGIYAVTFNLFDALPADRVTALSREADAQRERLRRAHGDTAIAEERAIARWLQSELLALADAGHGSTFFRNDGVARAVADAFLAQDGVTCQMLAWCLMPNHVHLVVRLLPPFSIAAVVRRWKGRAARLANQILGREGLPFWQKDYFDRTVRSPDELRRWVEYVESNPVQAGLREWRWCHTERDRLSGMLMR